MIYKTHTRKALFREINPEFIEFIRRKVLEEGYSFSYACRVVQGGILTFYRNKEKFPELIEINKKYKQRVIRKGY